MLLLRLAGGVLAVDVIALPPESGRVRDDSDEAPRAPAPIEPKSEVAAANA